MAAEAISGEMMVMVSIALQNISANSIAKNVSMVGVVITIGTTGTLQSIIHIIRKDITGLTR